MACTRRCLEAFCAFRGVWRKDTKTNKLDSNLRQVTDWLRKGQAENFLGESFKLCLGEDKAPTGKPDSTEQSVPQPAAYRGRACAKPLRHIARSEHPVMSVADQNDSHVCRSCAVLQKPALLS